MGSKSKSSTTNTTKNANFVNNNYGGEAAGSGSALADNINMMESELTTGDISIKTTDQGAVEAGRDIAVTGIEANAQTMEKLISGAYDDLGEGRDFAASITGNALDGFQRTTEMALQRNAEAIKNSLAFAGDSTRSDAGLTLETITPWAFGAVIVIALVLMWSNRK